MLTKLISIDSITGKEQEIQMYILNLLASYGLKPFEVKGNVVVAIKGLNNNKCLIFNSHVDTVGTGDLKLWKMNPYSGKEKSGKIFGLGASDNKASVAVLLSMAKQYALKKPECNVILTFTIGEEVDGHGTNDTVKWLQKNSIKKYKKTSAVVCEPTSLNCIGLAHKGNLFITVKTYGNSGHGSKPIKSEEHAVLKMYKVIKSLKRLNIKWGKKYKNIFLGVPTIGLATSIQAGEPNVANKFPDVCTATFDIRTVPEMHSIAFDQIKQTIGSLAKIYNLYPPVEFGFTDKSDEIAKVFKNVTGLKFVAFSGSSDMPFFTKKGIPTVIFGPGEMDVVHKPNEYCFSDKIDKCTEIFKEVVKRYNNSND